MSTVLGENKKIQKSTSWKNDKVFNTENMLPISEIRWDVIVLKDWGLRSIIKVYGLNLDLRNYDEQQIVITQYKRFLSSLDFPIQVLVRSTYLDITDYIDYLRWQIFKIDNDVLKWQWQQYVNFLDDINLKQWLIYTKEFYIIVPYYDLNEDIIKVRKSWISKFIDSLDTKDSPDKIVSRYRTFVKNRQYIETRCNLIMEWLKSFWVVAEKLSTYDIISLLFKIYNPNSQKSQSEISHE